MPKGQEVDKSGLYTEADARKGGTALQRTFSTLSYITLGDKYNKKVAQPTRFAGKQFATTVPKKGHTADAYFAGKFEVMLGSFADTQPTRYLKTQPREHRKKGFGSGDAHKRDLGMNATMGEIMTHSYRKEAKLQKLAQLRAENSRPNLSTHEEEAMIKSNGKSKQQNEDEDDLYDEGRNGPEFMFDIGRSAETSFCPRSKRDRWYEPRMMSCTTSWSHGERVAQGVTKRLGSSSVHLSSQDIGMGARQVEERTKITQKPVDYEASPHVRRSVILQEMFSRSTGILLPPFNQNNISKAGPPGSVLSL